MCKIKRKAFCTSEQRNDAQKKYRAGKKEVRCFLSVSENKKKKKKLEVLGLSRAEGLRLAIKKL